MKARASERLIIVRLTLSQWYPRKYDAQASRELAERHGASLVEEVARVNKVLVNLSTIKPLQREFAMLRARHYDMTAPWSDKGERVLPIELYLTYTQMISDFKRRIDRLADEFCFNEYDKQLELAGQRLGTLFRAGDYPDASDVRQRFGIAHKFEPIPDPSTMKNLSLAEDVRNELLGDAQAAEYAALKAAQTHIVDRLVTVANEFVDKVRKYDNGDTRRLYASALENLRDVSQLVLDGLNIDDDKTLHDMAERIFKAIDGLATTQLKDNETSRRTKTEEVEQIVDEFSGLFGGWER